MSHVARGKFCAKSSGFRLVYPMIGNEQRIVFRLKKAFGKGRENSISLSAGLSYFLFFFLSPQRYMPYDHVNENGRKNNTQRCKAYPKPLVKIAKSISNMIFTWKKSDFRDVFFIRTNAIKRQTKSMDAINKKKEKSFIILDGDKIRNFIRDYVELSSLDRSSQDMQAEAQNGKQKTICMENILEV